MLPLLLVVTTACVGLNARDVREFEKLMRADHPRSPAAHARLLWNSPSCQRIAIAAGYRDRKGSVIEIGQLYVVAFGDEIRVVDRQLRPVAQQRSKRKV